MERGKGLERRTPLSPGTKGLSRGKGLAAGKGLTRRPAAPVERAPLARQQPARRPGKPRVAPEVRDAVLARSRGRCEVAVTDACRARRRRLDSPEGTNQHHRHPGGMGGSKRAAIHAAPGLLQVCGQGNTSGCHGWIENHRTEAKVRGWLVPSGSDPAEVPVELWDGRRVLLRRAEYVELAQDTTAPA